MTVKDLINEKLDVSISQFCREINVSRRTIYNILEGRFTPSLSTVNKICKYFNVKSRDYID